MGVRQALVFVAGVGFGITVLAATPADPQSVRDACALVTQQQVSSAFGAPVGAGQPIGTTGCQWTAEPGTKAGRAMITLSIWGEKWFSNKSTPGVEMKPVSGIGDDAHFARLGNLTSLFVKKGTSTLQLRVYGLSDTPRQEAIERSLATDALAKW